MTAVSADKVIVELEARLDKYKADVIAARGTFEQAMKATGASGAAAEASIERSSAGIGQAVAGSARTAKEASATIGAASRGAAETYTVAAETIARASQIEQRAILATAATAKQAEATIRGAGAGIASGLTSLAGPLAALFAAHEVTKLADEYIKFTNAIRVTGIEGKALADTQDRLFNIAQRYGAPLESLGTLYSRAAIAGKELNLSQADLIKFTEGTAAAFKIGGVGAQQQRGALLELSEAIAEPIVRARQLNALLAEAPVIVQAAARGAGESVAEFSKSIREGQVTNKQFFDDLTKGYALTIAQADKFSLTLSASFTVIANAFSKYIGEANQSLGVTDKFAAAAQALAANINLIVPALATIAVGYGAFRAAGSTALKANLAETVELTAAVLSGNATLLGGKAAAAAKATAVAEGARIEQAAIELTIAELRAERAEYELTAASAARVAGGSLGGATKTGRVEALALEAKAKQSMIAVDAELAFAEADLAAAQRAVAVSAQVETAAIAETTIAARLGAAATGLFSGALSLIGGTTVGGAVVLTIGAIVGAIILFRDAATKAKDEAAAFANAIDENNRVLGRTKAGADAAADGVRGVGSEARSATASMNAFAGSVGAAAEKLYTLAAARRAASVAEVQTRLNDTKTQINILEQRQRSRAEADQYALPTAARQLGSTEGKADAATLATLKASIAPLFDELGRRSVKPLESNISTAERQGTVGDKEKLTGLQSNLAAARAAKDKEAVILLTEQVDVLRLKSKYLKDGLDAETAATRATQDAAKIRQASEGSLRTATGNAGARAAASAERKDEAAKRKAAAEVKAADGNDRAYDDAYAKAQDDILKSARNKALSIGEQADIARAEVDAERARSRIDIAAEGKARGYSKADTDTLQAQQDEIAANKRAAIDLNLHEQQNRERYALANSELQLQAEAVDVDRALATTSRQRRDAELKLLDLKLREIQLQDDAVQASETESDAAKAESAARRRVAERLQSSRVEIANQQTDSPGQAFARSANRTAGELRDSIEGVAADGLKNLNSGIANAITGAGSLAGAFKNVTATILNGLIQIGLQKAVIGPLANALFGAAGSSGGGALGGFLSSILGRATGGDVQGGRTYLVGENGPELFTPGNSGDINPNRSLASAGNSGGVTVIQPHSYDLRGAVMTSDLLAQMDAKANDAAIRGAAGGEGLAQQSQARRARYAL